MRRITVLEHLSLDGVMQAPDEDTRDGKRPSPAGTPVDLRLVESVPTTTGAVVATDEPVR